MSEEYNLTDLPLSGLLRRYLSAEGCTQAELSRRSGVNEGLISRLLSEDRTSISLTTARRLSLVLRVTPEHIMKCAKKHPTRSDLRTRYKKFIISDMPKGTRTRFVHPFPLQTHFTGRQKERKELSKWFYENNYPVLIINGPRGIGTTSLAWVCVQQDFLNIPIPGSDDDLDYPYLVSAGNYLEVVLWWCFDEPNADFASFLSEAIRFIGQQDITPVDMDINKQVDIVIALLQEHRTLLVLDSLYKLSCLYSYSDYYSDSSVLDPASRFLEKLTAIPASKTLITTCRVPSRLKKFAGCKIKNLGPLSEKDSVRFLKRLRFTGSDSELLRCAHECNGNPLALRLLVEERIRSQKANRVPRVITET